MLDRKNQADQSGNPDHAWVDVESVRGVER